MRIVIIRLLHCVRDDLRKSLIDAIVPISSLNDVNLPRQRKGLMW